MKTIIFDVDDTLYDQLSPFRQAITVTFTELVGLSEEKMRQLYLDFRYFSDKVFYLTVDGRLSLTDMRTYRIREALKKQGIQKKEVECQAFQDNYEAFQHQITLQPKMKELLIDLKSQGFSIGILTNGPTSHQKKKIKQLEIENYIPLDNIFISGEIGMAKPNVDVFRYIESILNLTSNEIIYIGDSYENDVIGAKGAGWESVWLNKFDRQLNKEELQPDDEVTSYEVLYDLIKEKMR